MMQKFINQIKQGENYFGTGSGKSKIFMSFATKFKNQLVKDLKKVSTVENVELSKMHYCLSMFMTVNGQILYISLSDVRSGNYGGDPMLLVRTAKNYTDYTGGSNHHITLDTNIAEKIIQEMNL